jgi:hypothetical protein
MMHDGAAARAMTILFERRSSVSAIWARRLAIFSAVLLATSTAGHRFGLVASIPFFWLLAIVAALAVCALLLAAFGFFRLWSHGDRGGRASTRATLIAIVVLLPFAVGAYRAVTLPRLIDVSTDTADPPNLSFAAADRTAGMNPVAPISADDAAAQAEAYPTLTGRRYTLTLDRMQEIVVAVAEALDWRVARNPQPLPDERAVTIEAVAPSPVFGLLSDVAIRIVDEGETTYVDMRSATRYGPHDLGDDAAKITRFFDALDAEVQARNAPPMQ